MKIPFPLPVDDKRHRYCQNCYSENVHDEVIEGKQLYKCDNCGNTYDRLIDVDPKLVWWVDQKTKDYWHESVGVFVTNPKKEMLFIERTIYPYGFTIPSGHLEITEDPEDAAKKELVEETGIEAQILTYYKDIKIHKDPCRRGADSHLWHVYTYLLENRLDIITNPGEGINPVWLTLNKALSKKLTPPVQYLLEKYGKGFTGS